MKQFLGLLLIGGISFASTESSAQTREFGTRQLSLDDNNGNRITLQTPPSGGWTGQRIWNIPLPPNNTIESGFTAKGTNNNDILAWDAALKYWKGGTAADLGLVTAVPAGTPNALPRFTTGSNLGNSRVTDDGSIIAIDGSDVLFNYGTNQTTFNTPIQSNQNIDLRGTLFDASGSLTLDDHVEVMNTLTVNGNVMSPGATLTIDDALAIAGSLSNTNGATPLLISDDLQVTGISNFDGVLRDLNSELTLDDQVLITGILELGSTLRATGTDLVFDDNVRIQGTLSNNNGATPLEIADDLTVTGISNLNGNVRDLNSELVLDDQVRTTSWLELGGALRATAADVVIEDNVRIDGTLSNNNEATELTINDDIIVTGITNLNGIVRDLNSELVLDDQVRTTSSLELGGAISRTGANPLVVDDNLNISGTLQNDNLFTELTINDDIIVTGISNLNGNVRDLNSALTIDDQLLVTGTSQFQQLLTGTQFLFNGAAAGNAITFGDANPNRTGLTINNTGGSPTSYGLRIGNTNRTQDGLTVDADRYAVQAQTESYEENAFVGAIDGMITGGAVSTIGDVGAAVVARGRATGGAPQRYSNAIILHNGAFAVGGGVMPAGQMLNSNMGAGLPTIRVNNPLCTSSSVVLLTPINADAATADLYVSTTANGYFEVTRNGAASADVDFNYFIITVVTP